MTITENKVEIPLKEFSATATACERIATALEKLVSLLEKEIEYWEEVDEDGEEIEGQMELEFEEPSKPKPPVFTLGKESSEQVERIRRMTLVKEVEQIRKKFPDVTDICFEEEGMKITFDNGTTMTTKDSSCFAAFSHPCVTD